jgi:RNA polymerase sigma-70 factor (ECF subfamily)
VLTDTFEAARAHLTAVAYRMLGSRADAEDAVQDAWLRLQRSDVSDVDNLTGWLTTVVSRICLDSLRARAARRDAVVLPDPIVADADAVDPETELLLAEQVGLALMVVLDELAPAERVAFVLHDLFAVPFEQIAPVVDRSVAATKMMASRARRRVAAPAVRPDPDVSRQREVVEAFNAAVGGAGFDALVAVLAPDVVLRAETAAGLAVMRGAAAVASRALIFAKLVGDRRPVLVNGAPGVVSLVDGKVFALAAFTVVEGRIAEIDIYADPARLEPLGLADVVSGRPARP